MQPLFEGEHYYYNEQGFLVFTGKYLRQRGTCCGNGCLHCPYEYLNVPEPLRTQLLKSRNAHEKKEN